METHKKNKVTIIIVIAILCVLVTCGTLVGWLLDNKNSNAYGSNYVDNPVYIAMGVNHSVAIDEKGHIYSWGRADSGRLGNNETSGNFLTPVPLAQSFDKTMWLTVAAGADHSLAIDANGDIYAWGANSEGQLGSGTKESKSIPTQIASPFNTREWKAVAAGGFCSFAIDKDGFLFSWGNNTNGQLGMGDISNATPTYPNAVAQPYDGGKWVSVSVGVNHVLALDDQGQIYAWGNNNYGQLGDGTTTIQREPTKLTLYSGDKTWIKIAAGENFSLALDDQGKVYTWGCNTYGQLGDGTSGDTEHKYFPNGIESGVNYVDISAGVNHAVALDSNGNIFTWGFAQYGQLGNGSTGWWNSLSVPNDISIPAGVISWVAITAGYSQSMAVDSNGHIYSWGVNNMGQLGDGTTEQKAVPTPLGGTFTEHIWGCDDIEKVQCPCCLV